MDTVQPIAPALERLAAIERLTDAALAQLPLERLLNELLERLRSAVRSDAVMAHLISEDQAELTRCAVVGVESGDPGLHRIPYGQGVAGRIASTGSALSAEETHRQGRRGSGLLEPFRSLLGVPLVIDGEVIGVLSVATRDRRRFSQYDQRLLELAADRVAPAINRANLLESWRRERERLAALSRKLVHVQEEERSRVARELHDEIGQLLTSLRLALRAGPVSGDLAEDILDDLFARARGISMSLRPPMLEDLGLAPTLLWHCERFTAQTGVRVDLRESGLERRFSHEAELAVFRIIQEALTNVARHAEAYEARVIVEGGPDCLRAQIIDHGIGFDAQHAPPGRSSGLTGMRERARSLEGRFSIHSEPKTGTRVSVWIPVAPDPSKDSEELR